MTALMRTATSFGQSVVFHGLLGFANPEPFVMHLANSEDELADGRHWSIGGSSREVDK